MEGAAAAHVCAMHDVPFLEVRGVSNLVEDRDRAAWRIAEAADAAQARRADMLDLDGPSTSPLEPLTLAYSPCPNDTFIFTPWVEGASPARRRRRALTKTSTRSIRLRLRGEPDVVKVSFHALGHLRDRYCLLRSGGALGRGCGPLVVAKTPFAPGELASKTVAIPGKLTTAALLVRLFAPALRDAQITVMPFDRIMPAVCEGRSTPASSSTRAGSRISATG